MMALATNSYSAVRISASELELGDVLVIRFGSGQSITLLPTRRRNGTPCWLYAKKSWLQNDRRAIERLIECNRNITAFDGFGSVRNGSVNAYVQTWFEFRLHEPLQFNVEITWEEDSKGRERSRSLGLMSSAGGAVSQVTASRLPGLARS